MIGFLDRYLSLVIIILVSSAVVLFKSFDKETQFKITLRKWRDFEKVTLGCEKMWSSCDCVNIAPLFIESLNYTQVQKTKNMNSMIRWELQ